MACRRFRAVTRYPIVIIVETVAFDIVVVIVVIGIYDGLYTIVLLHKFEPLLGHAYHLFMLLLHGRLANLEVEDRWQVTFFKRRIGDKIFHLLLNGRTDTEKMIGTTDDADPLGLAEIALEHRVDYRDTLGTLHESKQHRLQKRAALAVGHHAVAAGT